MEFMKLIFLDLDFDLAYLPHAISSKSRPRN